MQAIAQPHPVINEPVSFVGKQADKLITTLNQVVITGFKLKFIRWLMWLNILIVSFKLFKKPVIAFKRVKALKQLRDIYRNQQKLTRFFKSGKRYFVSYNIPGWPSKAFNRYVAHQLTRFDSRTSNYLHTLVFAITKKCGFQCEHCCEWLNLNKPETLSKEDLLLIINRFHQLGVAQVQLSGGEPLNRLDDILYLLDESPKGIDFWLYTTGYSLTERKAKIFKSHGLTGITISLDHHIEEKHNSFRGVKDSYTKALAAVGYAKEAGLAVCFSLCATKDFINEKNLLQYAELAKKLGVTFIQILEPKAVGHYAGQNVLLSSDHIKVLESFYESFNYDPGYKNFPTITYHGYGSRRFGCSGSGVDYVYVDTDGDIHNCPFCQRKLFSAFDDDLQDKISNMKTKGCAVYIICSSLK